MDVLQVNIKRLKNEDLNVKTFLKRLLSYDTLKSFCLFLVRRPVVTILEHRIVLLLKTTYFNLSYVSQLITFNTCNLLFDL